jgi:dipeptidyl aminopeptidase/acylaminoacyl peptidase
LFASQGYIVVGVNPTGSTSFGQKFTDDIRGDWGGSESFHTVEFLMEGTLEDLLAGYRAALVSYPEVRSSDDRAET